MVPSSGSWSIRTQPRSGRTATAVSWARTSRRVGDITPASGLGRKGTELEFCCFPDLLLRREGRIGGWSLRILLRMGSSLRLPLSLQLAFLQGKRCREVTGRRGNLVEKRET